MALSDAWLLKISEHVYVAIGHLEMVHIHAEVPERLPRLEAGDYCQHQIMWQERYLPLLDIGAFLEGRCDSDNGHAFLCIVAYYIEEASAQDYGAIISLQLPTRIQVDDEDVCELPEPSEKWDLLAASCFRDGNFGAVPILDLTRIFSLEALS